MSHDGRRVLLFVCIVSLAASMAPFASERDEPRPAADRSEGVGTVLEIAVPPEQQAFTPSDRGMRRSNRPLPAPERYFSKDRSDPAFRDATHEYLRFDEVPSFGRRLRLRDSGILLTEYVGDRTYVAAINAQGSRFLRTASGIQQLGSMRVEDKVEARLLAGQIRAGALAPSGEVLLDVEFHRTVDLDTARAAVEAHGGTVLNDADFSMTSSLQARVRPDAVESFAGEDVVLSVNMKRPETTPKNLAAAEWSHTDVLWDPPYDLSGDGLSVSVIDVGAIHPHPEFGGRIVQYVDWSLPLAPEDYSSHTTHGTGTIGAAGTLGPFESTLAHGMANQVHFFSFDTSGYNVDMINSIAAGFIHGAWNGWGYNIGWWFFPGCDQSDGCLPPIPPQWVFSNSIQFGTYNADSRAVDQAAKFAEDSGQIYPIVFPAGNDRDDGPNAQNHDGTTRENPDESFPYYDSLGPPGTAKDCITVGAITDGEHMSNFSSWGPADDGRVKPDLVAKGYAFSPDSASTYGTQVGTSTAAATVLGSSLLVIEEYENIFATQPTNGELKALLLHTAKDLGNPGPDAVYGYGLLDTQAAVDLLRSSGGPFSITSGTVDDGIVNSYNVNVVAGTPYLKATLAWMDAAAVANASVPLVNDIDLRLVSPSGVVYYPYSLSAVAPVADATVSGPNNRDTVEQVRVEFPEPGMWTVQVEGIFVPLGPQKYGVVSGILSGPAIYDQVPPRVPMNYPIPYPRFTIGARFSDPTGVGLDLDSVQMIYFDIDVTDLTVITPDGISLYPPADFAERDHYLTVSVSNLNGVQTTEFAAFDHVRASEVSDLKVNRGGSGQPILSWGNSDYDPNVLWLAGYEVHRSTDLQTELENIATTASFQHGYTDNDAPAADLVFYEVHALFEGVSGQRILSIRNTEHRTQQPFIGFPRPSNLATIQGGGTVLRIFGMAEPGSEVTAFVDGVPVGSTTALAQGSFNLSHDFGASGPYTLWVQAKVEGKSISVPSVAVDFEIP